jgi:hypothetical protein
MANLTKILKDIESGNRPSDDIDITQFFTKLSNGEYVPDMTKRIQVRNRDRDVDFVERTVNKINKTDDRSKLSTLTTVFFPKSNAVKLLNGNHTAEIELLLGMQKAPANSINFDTELDGKMSLARRLGNILNREEVERNSTSADDVKGELYAIMDERIAAGKDAKPSEDEIQELIDLYPFVSRPTIGQWISYHQQGGSRRAPLKSYTNQALKDQHHFYKNQRKYKDYVVLEPRSLSAWIHTGTAQCFIQCKNENKKKVLVPFYCSTIAEVNQLEEKRLDLKIDREYKELSDYWGIIMEADYLSCE